MKIEKHLPAGILKPFVKTFMIVESENGTESQILPDTSIVLAFRIKGAVAQKSERSKDILPSAMISGLRNSLRVVDYSPNSAMLLVAFREGGANAFFDESLYELFGTGLPLDDLWRRSKIVETEEKLSEAKSNREKIKTIENFLLSQSKANHFDLLIFNAVQKIKTKRGDVNINELLKFFHTSRDPFEKRFRRVTGTSPKQFSQIVRLRSLISSYSPEKKLTDLAAAYGYFDQAHFIKDFKSFTGLAPRQFFNSASYW